jgi:hypothetical protein
MAGRDDGLRAKTAYGALVTHCLTATRAEAEHHEVRDRAANAFSPSQCMEP